MLRDGRSVDSEGWNRRYADFEWAWGGDPNRLVAEELAALPAGRALDLAAGEGRHALWLARRGWRVAAVDFSDVGLEKGRRQADAEGLGGRIEWIVADVLDYAPAPASLDLVLVAYLQLPAADLEKALTNAAGGLAPGGLFLLVNHDRTNIDRGTGGPQDPDVLQSPEQVADCLSSAGLEVLTARTLPRTVAGAARPALDCVVTARRGEG